MQASYLYIRMWNTKIGCNIIPDLRIYRYRTCKTHDIRWDIVIKSHIVAPRNVFLSHRVRYRIRCRRLLRHRSRYRSAKNRSAHIGKTDIVPDIVYVKPIFYPISGTDIISHCSKQWRKGRWWQANAYWWFERLLRTGHCTSQRPQATGPYASFLPSMPDWINMTQDEYNKSSEALPLPAVGPVPPGISLEQALKVSYHMLMHQYNFIGSDIGSDMETNRTRYPVSGIVHDMVPDIVYDMWHTCLIRKD